MNYDNQKLIDMLAAEYVLGTLKGSARKRFQRLMLSSNRVREATWMWEQHLNNLASSIKSVPPDSHVWEAISQRIDPQQAVVPNNVIQPKTSIWQAWSLIATAASIVLALIIWQPQTPVGQNTQQIALFKDASEKPLWFIDINEQGLSIKASDKLTARTDKDYELWMILKGQDAPISLGLLPKDGVKSLLKDSRFNAQDIALLAISLEPIGGSPTGSPTEVLYTTELILL
ncbi:anti-sigma factor [Pseudoalteromonas sp. SR44-5]|uniref:anti-sigma factor n=1 Tax=Pseudoalteromonas TaxID=53246 RepID=UPI001230A7C1|nr:MULTISPECIES: anti-sigma factor [Pseudoalteromonas]MBB1331950.1 anti-sigma factor [Pseudoalteromonas sp. SR41-6]MBB1340823.1 anti-sigma factor [Pseudoalteromonas sp. SR45-6]MBB1365746.1 anti-sigma factor [Pseudoalteromonas sp. SR44-5]MBB1416793.1 anti-sigma factor [Pseudoalteromonas sp. SG44-1]MBB1420541.1 anti-sigma factor [Pseudoalteromonas sp. SG43-7]